MVRKARSRNSDLAAQASNVSDGKSPELGDSWVVDDEAEESDDSFVPSDQDEISDGGKVQEIEIKSSRPKQETPKAESKARNVTLTNSQASLPRTYSEQQFVMPAIDHSSPSSGPLRQRKQALTPSRKKYKDRQKRGSYEDPESNDAIGTFLQETWLRTSKILFYFSDVLGTTLHILKTPLSYLLAAYLIIGAVLITRNFLTESLNSAFSPICRVPGASFLHLPFCQAPSRYTPNDGQDVAPPAEFDRLMSTQSKFEDILSSSATSVSLPLDMKRSEASVRDLRTVVRYSSLKSRNELVLEFDGFIETARMASYDLQRFNSHVGRSVDNILATAHWTQRVLDGIEEERGQRGAVAAWVSNTLLAPFQPVKFTPALLLDQYVAHTRVVEEEIARLLDEAQALLMVLQNLDDRLDVIASIGVRESGGTNIARDDVLGKLWTKLGGNRGEIAKFDKQLKLLQQVELYRQNAFAHVSATILKLQAMGAELEDLRERVGSTELLKDREDVPLSVHLENIQLGVERLEAGRESARKVEKEYLNKALDRDSDVHASVQGRLING